MKQGRTLAELAVELQRQSEAKRDLVAPVAKLGMEVIGNEPQIVVADKDAFELNAIAHDQLATYVDIPRDYYKRMQTEEPKLLADNVNKWLRRKEDGERRMVRTLDGNVRAFLSDKYRCIENADAAEALIPILLDLDVMVVSCELTERRMYIKVIDERVKLDVPTGRSMGDGTHTFFDTCSPAMTFGNSEVGFGAFYFESGVFTKICTNLAMIGTNMRRRHVGARAEFTDDVVELLSDETKRLSDAALFAQLGDVCRGAFDEARFKALTMKLEGAAQDKIEADVVEVVERFGRKNQIQEGTRKSILQHLIEGADLTRYGLHAAVTRTAQDTEDYDTATELERLGGKVIELPKTEWKALLKAA